MNRISQIRNRLQPLRRKLLQHAVYRRLEGMSALRTFLEHHVFAVWDFMSLLKDLQRRFSVATVPWVPPTQSLGCRLVNEIVLGEESDEDGRGGYGSHFELYRNAMQTCGANTQVVDDFIDCLRRGESLSQALDAANVPAAAQQFVRRTFDVIRSDNVCAIAADFLFGREDLLPDVFQQIVDNLHDETGKLGDFLYYLHRHIELDGDQHGPLAESLIAHICGDDESKWQRSEEAARHALQARLALWDGVLISLDARQMTA